MFLSMNYQAAYAKALEMANASQRETGIERAVEFGRVVYLPKHLPNPENRMGWELRCEIVRPGSPAMGLA